MIFLFMATIVFFFLVLGSIAFLLCILVPPGRKYALSTALWFAAWGPCSTAFLILGLLGLIAGGFAFQATQMHWEDSSRLISSVGRVSLVLGGMVACAVASVAAWLHQVIIHRFTFPLFRLYVTLVVAGIGSTLGLLVVTLCTAWSPFPYAGWASAPSIPILTIAFGTAAYRHSPALRGSAPTNFTWITEAEFTGRAEPES